VQTMNTKAAAKPIRKVGMDLTEGSVMRALVFFAIPIVIANLIQQFYSLVDLIVIGKFMGSTGTVGVSTGGEVSDALTPIATAFSTAGQIYIAQLAGAKENRKFQEAVGSFITLMLMISIGFVAMTLMLRAPILHALNCPEEGFTQADRYMFYTALGLPFIFGYNAICGILRGLGESKWPMIFIIISAIVNIFLDILLVAPPFNMEAAGAAIATSVSQFASCMAAFIYMFIHRKEFGMTLNISSFKLHREPVKIIMYLGIPQACRSLLVRFGMLYVNACVNAYGLVASATNSIGNKLQKFLEVYTMGFSQASSSVVGQNLGAGKPKRAKEVIWYSFYICMILAAVTAVVTFLFPRQIFEIFTSDDAVIRMGKIYLYIMIIHYFCSAVTSSFQSMVIGCGNAALNFILGLLDGVVCKIGLGLLFGIVMGMGAVGYFWGTALSRLIPGIIVILYFLSGKWAERKLLSGGAAQKQ
jgi:putative MATE family efflux protein